MQKEQKCREKKKERKNNFLYSKVEINATNTDDILCAPIFVLSTFKGGTTLRLGVITTLQGLDEDRNLTIPHLCSQTYLRKNS